MLKRFWLLPIVLLLGIAHMPLAPVNAQSQPCGIDYTWVNVSGTPDYVSFSERHVDVTTTYSPLTRANNANLAPSSVVNNANWQIVQTYATDWVCVPRIVRMVYKRETLNSAYTRFETSMDGVTWTNQTTNLTNASIALNSPINTVRTATWTNSANVAYKYIRLIAGSANARILSFYIDADDAPATYIKPLKSSDQSSIVTDGATVATATRGFLPVHAPANATVTSITPLDSDDCTSLGVSIVTCATITLGGTYKVVLSVDDTPYTYIIANAPDYMSEGQGIPGGCIMGESTQVVGVVVSTIALSFLVDEPDEEALPCKDTPPPPEDCLNDGLSNSSSWYKSGAVTWGDEVVLGSGGKIYQIITMPIDSKSRLIVVAGGESMSLRLGNTISSFNITIEPSTNQLDFAVHQPNLVDFWEVAIQNTGTDDLTISSVCVDIQSEGTENNYDAPANRCYFRDFGFSDIANVWFVNGDVQDGTGMALIPNGGGVSQPVTLLPNEYVLSLDIGLWIDDDFDIDANSTEIITVAYVFALDEPPEYVDYPTMTIGDVGDNQNYRISVTFTIEEETDGDFYIEIGVPTLAGLDGLSISRACLSPTDGDWGDNPPLDDGLPFTEACETISPPRGQNISVWVSWHWFNLSQFFECDLMATLNNTYGLLRWFQAMAMLFFNWLGDMGTWINGHVQNLIFAITNAGALTEYQLPDDVPSNGFWDGGGGGFSGLSFIQSEELDSPMAEDCNWYDVFCHGKNIVGGVVDFAGGVVTDVLSALINFIGALLGQILDWITWGFRQFFDSIKTVWDNFWVIIQAVKDTIEVITDGSNMLVDMWNTTDPLSPAGLEDCQVDPETKNNCLVFWVAENTIFSGEYGQLIIPLLTSILGIFGIWLVIQNFMALVTKAKDA
jgi:hypothetical protein